MRCWRHWVWLRREKERRHRARLRRPVEALDVRMLVDVRAAPLEQVAADEASEVAWVRSRLERSEAEGKQSGPWGLW
jgi:hypothetical protein